MPELREKLWTITRAMQKGLRDRGFNIGKAQACVTPVFLKGNVAEATNILIDLRQNYKIFCSVVIYPVVPKDVIMFRLIPTAMHSLEDVEYTLDAFGEIQEKLKEGKYKSEEMQDMALEK
jgi:glycine C-acetyltransferase